MASVIADIDFLRQINQSGQHMMWLLGAGASRSSGLPTATDICWDLKRRIYCAEQNQDIQIHDVSNKAIQNRIQSYMDSQGFPPLWDTREYSFYFEKYFGNDYSAQQKYLGQVLSTKRIASTVGHRALAAMLQMGRSRLVFTTNFDEVVETAYAGIAEKNLPTFHIEGAYAAADALNADQFPLYVKLHGDFRYQSIKNLSKDLLENDQHLQKCFVAAAARFGIIVAGYSGRDENVMSMLRQAVEQNNAFPHGLYWTAPRLDGIASNVHELINYAKSKGIRGGLVQTGTFDEMLSKIWRQTSGKTEALDRKVRCAVAKHVSIPLPTAGGQFPVLRTNALRITRYPKECSTLEYVGEIDIGDIRSKQFEAKPNCTFTYTDRILFWGDRVEMEKVVDPKHVRAVNTFPLENLASQLNASGHIKSIVEEALAKALTVDRRLSLRRAGRNWYVVVNHECSGDAIFQPLQQAVGHKGSRGPINGYVPGSRDLHWAEAVSLHLETRSDSLWLLLRPDIWISPLKERQSTTDFLRNRKLKRWNTQSYDVLSAWIGILFGAVGGALVEVTAHPDSSSAATFEISTRTAYSRRSTSHD